MEGFPRSARFDARRRLGAGAFGVVYEAFDRERQLLVALKTIRSAGSDALYLFKREFRSLADLQHPNLVALYELLAEGSDWFFTMELLHGRSFIEHAWDLPTSASTAGQESMRPTRSTTLASLPAASALDVSRPEPLGRSLPHVVKDFDRLRGTLVQLADGLNALHQSGKLHRDIKPRNVMVTFEGRVVLLDFGLVADVTGEGADPMSVRVAGTPAYMAPEQAAGGHVWSASDWYSVGAMMYETLAGRLPFDGSTLDILTLKQRSDPPPVETLVANLPSDLVSLCQDLLARDPARRPTGAQVIARLDGSARRTAAARANRSGMPASRFVGRDVELAELREAFAAMRTGRAVVSYVHGLSGMGKTTLIQRFLHECERREPEALILSGRCFQQETVPYKAFDLIVDSLSQRWGQLPPAAVEALVPPDALALTRLFPVLRRVDEIERARRSSVDLPDAQELRRLAIAAFRELLLRLATRWPTVLFVDDLQWSDLDSTHLLGELLRPPHPPPILFLGAYRRDEAETSPALRALLALHRTGQLKVETRDIPLRELGLLEVRTLVGSLVGVSDNLQALTDLVHRESGGNPFFVQELARLAASGQETIAAGDITLESAVASRLSTIGATATRLLKVLALAARPLVTRVAIRAAEMSPSEFAVLASLRGAQLVRTRETDRAEEIEIYHDRIREAVSRTLAPDEAISVHDRLATAIEASGDADPEVLVFHLSKAGHLDRAARNAVLAADRAATALAFDRAARLYGLALQLGSHRSDPADLRIKLADTLANAGRGSEAGRAYLAAAADVDRERFVELQRRAAEQFLIGGHLDEGHAALERVLQAVSLRLARTPLAAIALLLIRRALIRLRGLEFRECDAARVPPRTLLRIDSCWSVAVGLAFVDPIRAADFQARHCLLALRSGEPYRVARALALEVGYSSLAGTRTAQRTQSVAKAATALSNRLGNPHAIGLAALTSGIAAHMEGRWRASLELTERADAVLRESCTGVAWELDTARLHIVSNLFFLGDLQALDERTPPLIKSADDRGDLYGSTALVLRTAFIEQLVRDEPSRAWERIAKAESAWLKWGFLMQRYWSLMARLDILCYQGRGGEARALITDQWNELARSQMLRVQFSEIESLYRRARSALLAAGELPASSAQRARLVGEAIKDSRRLTRMRAEWGAGLGHLVAAGAQALTGERDGAIAHVTLAREKLTACGMDLHATIAQRALGILAGGEEGKAAIAASEGLLKARAVQNPAAFQLMIAGWG